MYLLGTHAREYKKKIIWSAHYARIEGNNTPVTTAMNEISMYTPEHGLVAMKGRCVLPEEEGVLIRWQPTTCTCNQGFRIESTKFNNNAELAQLVI